MHQKLLMAVLAVALGCAAQERVQVDRVVEAPVPPVPPAPPLPGLGFVHHEFSLGGSVVKNAPYQADAVTESVQVLPDGNRIVRKNSIAVARDSQGRTRRDLAPMPIGPLSGADAPKITVIHDPVSDVSYTLDHQGKVARKLKGQGMIVHMRSEDGTPDGSRKEVQERRVEVMVDRKGDVVQENHVGPVMIRVPKDGTTSKKEGLGKQNVEGLICEGTRTVNTIAPGTIGNERPIEVVHEQWYSPELQTVVLTKHKDPRAGETTYKLSGIRRGEPAASLFEVPAGYTVKEAPEPRIQMMRRPAPPIHE